MTPARPELPPSPLASFVAGCRSAWTSVFSLVLIGTYMGIGALAHDYGFSLGWVLLSTLLVWAGPAQVILISALGAGASPVEVALAVSLSGIRLLPMVISLLPLIKEPQTRARDLVLPAHLTAVSMWVESLRILPKLPRSARFGFCNGLGAAFMAAALLGSVAGFHLSASLPLLFSAALLFLTPMSFLVSTVRNTRTIANGFALALGLLVGPLLAYEQIGLDLMWTGIVAGSAGYLAQRLREALR